MIERLKTFIIDDERLARDELRFLLAAHPETVVVGEDCEVKSALEGIARLQPDVVFLDLQLRGESGLDLLEHLPDSTKIVFVTGFEEQAMQALEKGAYEYLLKPINPARLALIIKELA